MKDRISELTRSGRRGRTTARQTTSSEMKNGRVELSSLSVPEISLPPGAEFEAVMSVKNHETFIINDPDGCSQAGTPCTNTTDGYCVRADCGVGGLNNSQTFCLNLPQTGIPPNTERRSFRLEAPTEPGEHEVQAKVAATNSNNETDVVSATITVEDLTGGGGGGSGGDDGTGGGGGSGGDDGTGGGGGGGGTGGGDLLSGSSRDALLLGLGGLVVYGYMNR